MKLHANEVEPNGLLEADVLLIGGGLVGLALGNQLADAGHQVLILESGEIEPDAPTQSLYEGKFTIGGPDHERRQDGYLAASRFRQFGGSGHQWGGVSLPLDPADFESRDWIPHSGWPLTLEQLKPFYNRACDLLDLPHFFGESSEAPPLTVGDGRVVHSRPQRLTRMTGKAENGPFQRWLQSTLDRERVRVILGANVTKLSLDSDAQRVASVDVKALSGRSFRARANVYVLATGGIENARLLLASNDVRPRGIGNESDWVGRAFQGHAMVFNAFSQLLPLAHGPAWGPYVGRRRGRTSYALGTTLAAQRASRTGNFGTYLRALPKAERNELALHGLALRLTGQEAPGTRVLRAPFAIEHTPNRDSRLELDQDSRDALGMPRVKLAWKHAAFDFESFERGVRQLARELGLQDVARLRWSRLGQQVDRFLQIGARHHMGTTRMAADSKQGVVDAQGRVHGVGNLYIGGSSIFPTSGLANPTLTIFAITLRLGDHLDSRIRRAA
ncbi:MAG: GMC family oxidoreductase [Acidobacteriota bacterium]